MTIKLTQMDGGTVDLSPELLQSFKTTFKGQVLTADDPEYEESRKIWNAMVDRRPGLVLARAPGHARRTRSPAGSWPGGRPCDEKIPA